MTRGQSGWQLRKEKNNIKVYTKNSDSSSYKSIKVEGVFKGSWEKLSSILMDVNSLEKWVYRTKRAYTIKKVGNNEVIYYTETTLPWPMNNRDVVIRMKLIAEAGEQVYKVVSFNETGLVPPKKEIVRIPYYKAEWLIRPLDENRIAITYWLDLQPGGGLTPWVVNMFVTTGPYETFERLAKMLRE